MAGALRPGRPAPPAGPAAGDLGPGARRPPGRGRGRPHGTDVLPAYAGRHASPRACPPDDVHLYAFDGAAGALLGTDPAARTPARSSPATKPRVATGWSPGSSRRPAAAAAARASTGSGRWWSSGAPRPSSARGSATGAAVGPALPYLVRPGRRLGGALHRMGDARPRPPRRRAAAGAAGGTRRSASGPSSPVTAACCCPGSVRWCPRSWSCGWPMPRTC